MLPVIVKRTALDAGVVLAIAAVLWAADIWVTHRVSQGIADYHTRIIQPLIRPNPAQGGSR